MTATTHTVETAAAEAIEILKQWKPVHDEYKATRAEVIKKMQDASVSAEDFHDVSEREDTLYAEHVRLCDEVCALMSSEVFSEATKAECMDWMYDEYDALMADLADIARGDY